MVGIFYSKKNLSKIFGSRDEQDVVFHPNRISAYGGLASGVGYGLLFTPVAPASLFFLGVGFGCDVADGYVAKTFEISSKEGAKLDPLIDKVKNLGFVGTAGLLGSLSNPILLSGSILSLGVDYVSQRQRGDIYSQLKEAYQVIENPNRSTLDDIIIEKFEENIERKEKILKANWFGKTKTGLQTGVHIAYAGAYCFYDFFDNLVGFENIETGLGVALGVSAVCGAKGVYDRIINK